MSRPILAGRVAHLGTTVFSEFSALAAKHGAMNLGQGFPDFDGPEEFLESLREADIVGRPSSLYYVGVQALKFLPTKATPATARRAARERRVRKATRNL